MDRKNNSRPSHAQVYCVFERFKNQVLAASVKVYCHKASTEVRRSRSCPASEFIPRLLPINQLHKCDNLCCSNTACGPVPALNQASTKFASFCWKHDKSINDTSCPIIKLQTKTSLPDTLSNHPPEQSFLCMIKIGVFDARCRDCFEIH